MCSVSYHLSVLNIFQLLFWYLLCTVSYLGLLFLTSPYRVFQVSLLSLIADLIALRSENVFSFLKLLYLLRLVFIPVCHQILKTLPFRLEKKCVVWSFGVLGWTFCWLVRVNWVIKICRVPTDVLDPPATREGCEPCLPAGALVPFSLWAGAAYTPRAVTASWWNQRFALCRVFSNPFFEERLFLTGGCLLYNIGLVAAICQRESATGTHVSPSSWTSLPPPYPIPRL